MWNVSHCFKRHICVEIIFWTIVVIIMIWKRRLHEVNPKERDQNSKTDSMLCFLSVYVFGFVAEVRLHDRSICY